MGLICTTLVSTMQGRSIYKHTQVIFYGKPVTQAIRHICVGEEVEYGANNAAGVAESWL